ncbi:MAG: glutaredoxin family protein [Oscillatoriales cyanobacterium SM2_1_8]|nr:glutaredoxin family protein [Oscillatoriales cyanobacterium SM2_1_8]
MALILYEKPGCHLCEEVRVKLAQLEALGLAIALESRNILDNAAWFAEYQYRIPVLCWVDHGRETELPRLSPRATVADYAVLLAKR